MSKIAKKSIITNLINIKTIKIIKTIKTIKTIKIIKITQIISLYRHNYLKTIWTKDVNSNKKYTRN